MDDIQWRISADPVDYPEAVAEMESQVAAIHAGQGSETVWLLEHPALYTAGTSARAEDLLRPQFPVYQTGRGGQYTYHGPGQRVVYVMLDLKSRQHEPDLKRYIWQLEEWVIRALRCFNIESGRRAGRVGLWTEQNGREDKIAAIGVRVRHWITFHGIAVNVDPDLSHFTGIVPCGIREHGVTSMTRILNRPVEMAELDKALKAQWPEVFCQAA